MTVHLKRFGVAEAYDQNDQTTVANKMFEIRGGHEESG